MAKTKRSEKSNSAATVNQDKNAFYALSQNSMGQPVYAVGKTVEEVIELIRKLELNKGFSIVCKKMNGEVAHVEPV